MFKKFFSQFAKMRQFSEEMTRNQTTDYLTEFDPWYPGFEKYLTNNFIDSASEISELDDDFVQDKLAQYLFSPSGAKYKSLFAFENGEQLQCGQPAPKVVVSFFPNFFDLLIDLNCAYFSAL
jgi:hypothetical protein